MVLKLNEQLSVPGIAQVNVPVDHEIYMHFWNIAVREIETSLGKSVTRPQVNRLAHKVIETVFGRLVTASLITLTPESLGEIVKNEVKGEVKDFIPGITVG